jgi:hypothetical protein
MFAQESLPPAIDEQTTASQLGLSEVEMARTLRAAVCSGVVLHALIKLVCGEFIFFARGDGEGEYRPGHHAGGGADLRMIAQPANLSFNAWLAVFAEITDDLRDYLHSALASRGAMSAVPENLPARLCENFPALISGSNRQTLPIRFPASSD